MLECFCVCDRNYSLFTIPVSVFNNYVLNVSMYRKQTERGEIDR